MSTAGIFGSVTIAGRNKQFKSALSGTMSDVCSILIKRTDDIFLSLTNYVLSWWFVEYSADGGAVSHARASQ